MKSSAYRRSTVAIVAKAALLSASCLAIAVASTTRAHAQAAPGTQPGASQLPPVQVQEPNRQPRRSRNEPGRRDAGAAARRRAAARTAPQLAPPSAWPATATQDARTGTVGIYS